MTQEELDFTNKPFTTDTIEKYHINADNVDDFPLDDMQKEIIVHDEAEKEIVSAFKTITKYMNNKYTSKDIIEETIKSFGKSISEYCKGYLDVNENICADCPFHSHGQCIFSTSLYPKDWIFDDNRWALIAVATMEELLSIPYWDIDKRAYYHVRDIDKQYVYLKDGGWTQLFVPYTGDVNIVNDKILENT